MELQTPAQPAPKLTFSASSATGCCPAFDPEPWQSRKIIWNDKLFVADHVLCVFHVPLNMRRRIVQNQRLIDAAGAAPAVPLMLSDESSRWGADLFMDVSRPVPGARMAKLSGTFLTQVYEGPYRDAGKWAGDMERYVMARGHRLEKLYFAYATCPACAKAYGKNYVILFAKVDDPVRSSARSSFERWEARAS